jgi:hypothetical protein
VLDNTAILDVIRQLDAIPPDAAPGSPKGEPARTTLKVERSGHARRARITVPGLDRHPETARHVVELLERHPGVRARANQLTNRVLVEYTDDQINIEDLVAERADLELPDVGDSDNPSDPLDPGPLIQSAATTAGSLIGIGLIAARRLSGTTTPLPGAPAAAHVARAI